MLDLALEFRLDLVSVVELEMPLAGSLDREWGFALAFDSALQWGQK